MTELRSSDQISDLRTHLHGLWLPLVTPFRDGALDEGSLRRLVRHYHALPIDGLVLAATTGESLTLDASETERLVFTVRDEVARRETFRFSSACPQRYARAFGHTRPNGGMADRRLPDLVSVLFAAVAARPRAALPRARRARPPSGAALQHSLPDRRQSRQRSDAASCRPPPTSSA